jgi:hypothetical protein
VWASAGVRLFAFKKRNIFDAVFNVFGVENVGYLHDSKNKIRK